MKRELRIADRLFNQTIVLNKMQFRQEKNLYSEMEKKGRVTLAVGGGGSLSECASVSL